MQQGAKNSATLPLETEKLQVARLSICNTQLSSITAHRLMKELIEAAMKACDHHGDGEAAREEMRLDCLATPQHLRGDLLDHFTKTYGVRP